MIVLFRNQREGEHEMDLEGLYEMRLAISS